MITDQNQELLSNGSSADSDTVPPREGFVFYFTFYDAIKTLPIRLRLKAIEILIEYARTGVVPEEMPSRIEQFFIMAKPQIDANERKRRNGFKGKNYGHKGAKHGKKGGRPSKKQTETLNNEDDEILE